MQAVPSLVGAGSAIAAAATGLAFGQLAEEQPPPRPDSRKRKSIADKDFLNVFIPSRPATTNSALPTPALLSNDPAQHPDHLLPSANATGEPRVLRRLSHTQITSTKSPLARYPSIRQADFAPASPIAEDSGDSVSSNGSWIRRFSIRPRSQHESPRSSVGPDSPSITFSHGSAAPILSPSGQTPAQLPPNKLVKRASAVNGTNNTSLVRRGPRPQMTLRRPATSHQRSATLHQQINTEVLSSSLDEENRAGGHTLGSTAESFLSAAANGLTTWKSFWHSRISRSVAKSSPLRGRDGNTPPPSGVKRICVEQQGQPHVHLVTPNLLTAGSYTLEEPRNLTPEPGIRTNTDSSPQTSNGSSLSPDNTPSREPRRSISMHFSPPPTWISKTGSLRRRKRGETIAGTQRHVSAPTPTTAEPMEAGCQASYQKTSSGTEETGRVGSELITGLRPPNGRRNSLSPLPPISRLSSFQIDLSKLGSSSTAAQGKPEESMGPIANSNTSHTRTFERVPTGASSEYHRGFTSCDDDDTDFKTDTPFDSLRTAASGRRRTLDSPLGSMFDESPPSTAGNNNKPKRLSIQEILGPSFDLGNRIMEEDESVATPVRRAYKDAEARFHSTTVQGREFSYSSASPNFASQEDSSRLSLDDDDDDLDWDKEDDSGIYNHLSPPGSMNSRKGSPNLRTALGHINGNGRRNARFDTASERPRSTVFDWTEAVAHEKMDGDGGYPRPKTVHGKHETDMRGGRTASRKGPIPVHVRSQSVPVVPDQPDTAKSVPKFGTWGLGQKNASEDWDDDFEFEEEGDDLGHVAEGKDSQFSMIVPASIQATQPTVKAHSGQIRELSLLVNDLKRLCRLGREMDMLGGSSAGLWQEAEGIITLASPDEDPADATGSQDTPDPLDAGEDSIDPRFVDHGFDGSSLDDYGPSRVTLDQRTTVARERPQGRRRSVFSPEDDIFGAWDEAVNELAPDPPHTPEKQIFGPESKSVNGAKSVMEAMQSRQPRPGIDRERSHPSAGKVNFDTNSLKELVKRAGDLRDGLSDLIRKVDPVTQSPARTPRNTRPDGSPAFTKVFDEPPSSPTKRMPHSHSSSSVLSSGSVGTSPSNGLSQRMQMMTVS
ncbi:hypothetical protein GGS23DRAFT_367942 [Durotheca rogersii]|uniref:uncharacterized protein n=1 Tax=Durotheca rogersii TaxID=419775 RepID=UPI00221F19F4|nr:uncharacterized protein GGS23DRAFT_367942 [Durotheca rogersii]KAI5866092.1 hypothetical protein GGS23DRAFT_367942 [Durotheca rogersii]